jgi:hypothetical protein
MAQNLVIANKDNLVVYVFGGVDLTLATDIQVQFGGESYSLGNDPLIVIVTSATELSLNLSATAEVGKVFSTVTYFDSASVLGTDITNRELGNSDKIVVAIGTQLIIEDGSVVADANSFATDEQFKTYANLRNFDVPATQPDREALLIQAMDYLFSKESLMQGCRVSINQELPYPRSGVCYNNFSVASTDIPKALLNAQMELAIQSNESSLLKTGTVQNIAGFEVVGAYKEDYFSGGNWEVVRTDRADAYLDPLLVNGGNSNIMVRV